MHIRDYQTWVEAWDKARAWDKTLPSHTLLHALEELGEISRLVQVIEGYRPAPGQKPTDAHLLPDSVREELALEFSDLQVMIFKLAYQCGIDMEMAMRRGQEKADARFPDPAEGPAEQSAYWRRFRAYIQRAGLEAPNADTLPDTTAPDPSGQSEHPEG